MSDSANSPGLEPQVPVQYPPAQHFPPVNALPDPNHIPAMALSGNNAQRTLWVGDVPLQWTEDKLGEVFSECSHIPYKVKRVFIKGELQHYCFVEFTSFEEARDTLYDLNGNRLPSTKKGRFNLCFANDSYNPNSEFNLHVSNLPTELSDAELYRVFDKYPSCRGAKMFRYNDGTSKGCGFVRFGDQTDQQMALLEMHRTRVESSSIQIRLAGPKGERLDREKGPGFRKERFGGNDRGGGGYKGPRQNMIQSYRQNQGPHVEKSINYYGADNAWAIMPEENDIDLVIGLDLLPAKYRPHTTNKRYMLDSEQFMLDLDSSRWTPVVMRINEKVEDFEKKLEASRWTIDLRS